MTVDTTFSIGDIVYIMENNTIRGKKYIIYQIIINILDTKHRPVTEYRLRTLDEAPLKAGSYNDNQIFKSKEDAIKLWLSNQGFSIDGRLIPL